MPNQSSRVRFSRTPFLAAILLLVSTGIAGVPIAVSWLPNPVPGNLPTDLQIHLDQPSVGEQVVEVTYDNPSVLNAAPITGKFVDKQDFLKLSVNTHPTTSEKHVFATVSTGGGSMKSDRLVISPTTIVDGHVGGADKMAVMPGAPPSPPGVKEGVPIAVSFLSNAGTDPVTELSAGGRATLFIQMPTKTEADRLVTVKFENGNDKIDEPALDGNNCATVKIPANYRGVSIQVAAKGMAQSGYVTVKATCGGCDPGYDVLFIKGQ